jgi:hypothetical protein
MTLVHGETCKRSTRPTHDARYNHATPLKPITHSHAAQDWGECMAESAERALAIRQTTNSGHCVTPSLRLLLLGLPFTVLCTATKPEVRHLHEGRAHNSLWNYGKLKLFATVPTEVEVSMELIRHCRSDVLLLFVWLNY